MKSCLVFIKREFIRDSEAFLGGEIPSDRDNIYFSCSFDNAWESVEGDILIAELPMTLEDARKWIHKKYPNASDGVFYLREVISTD